MVPSIGPTAILNSTRKPACQMIPQISAGEKKYLALEKECEHYQATLSEMRVEIEYLRSQQPTSIVADPDLQRKAENGNSVIHVWQLRSKKKKKVSVTPYPRKLHSLGYSCKNNLQSCQTLTKITLQNGGIMPIVRPVKNRKSCVPSFVPGHLLAGL